MSTVRVIASVMLLLAAVGAAGCDGDPDRPTAVTSPATRTPSPATGTPSPAAGCQLPDLEPVDAGSVVVPGPSNGLRPPQVPTEALVIEAVLLDATCRRVPAANVYVWHTDARGDYGPRGTDKCCYYQARFKTDPNGRFRVETIRPARYPQPDAPPAHIHFEIRHGSHELNTQIVFGTGGPGGLSLRGARIVPVPLTQDSGGGPWRGEAAFVLAA